MVTLKDIRANFERRLYNEKACSGCENKPLRFNDICAACKHYQGHFILWSKKVSKKGKKFVALPAGNVFNSLVGAGLDPHAVKIVDKRSDIKAKHPLTFVGKLRTGKIVDGTKTANQKRIVAQYLKKGKGRGMIEARARTGKTVMAVYLICKLKRRTLVVAHDTELLRQFYRTLRNNTNLAAVEAKLGRKVAGIIETPKELVNNKWDIVLCTYQSFIRERTGDVRVNKYLRSKFGHVIVDEAHLANAACYSRFINRLDFRRRTGLTATVARKDRLEFLVKNIIGPVVVEAHSGGMTPVVKVTSTKFTTPNYRGLAGYTKTVSALSNITERNAMLVKQAFKDLRSNPKHCILIPVTTIKHAKLLVHMINRQAEYNNDHRGENWDEKLALGYFDKCVPDRDEVLKRIRKGTRTRIIVAIRQLCKLGLDILPLTHIYMQFPMNNAADFYQMTQRVLTPYKDKPQPIVHMYVDDTDLSRGCFVASWNNGVRYRKYTPDPECLSTITSLFDTYKQSLKKRSWRSSGDRGMFKGNPTENSRPLGSVWRG